MEAHFGEAPSVEDERADVVPRLLRALASTYAAQPRTPTVVGLLIGGALGKP